MRLGIALLSLSACVCLPIVVACARPTPPAPPGPAAAPPTVAVGPAPAPPTAPPATADWLSAADFPSPKPSADRLWAPDEPKPLQPVALGKLPSEQEALVARPKPSVFKLETKLLQSPEQLPVYVAGRYPDIDPETLDRKVQLPGAACQFVGLSSQIHCEDRHPIGPTQPIGSPQQAELRAKELAQSLWMPDLITYAVEAIAGGEWRVVFVHGIKELPIYSDHDFQVVMNRSGQLVYLHERRRPVIARSLYPARAAEDAWNSLQAGRSFAFDAAASQGGDGTMIWGAGAPEAGEPFIITKVEIGYVVPHVYAAREIMQPYYIFRNDKRQALFVPAVAEAHVTWPPRYRDDPYR